MTETEITYDNIKWLYTFLETTEEVNEVSKYLKQHNKVITIRSGPDVAKMGQNIYLEGKDLSINGFCFNGSNLLYHVRNHHKYIEISGTKEYEEYIILRAKYEKVHKYITKQ